MGTYTSMNSIRRRITEYLEARGGRIRHGQWFSLIALYRKDIREDLTANLVRRTERYFVLRKKGEEPTDV